MVGKKFICYFIILVGLGSVLSGCIAFPLSSDFIHDGKDILKVNRKNDPPRVFLEIKSYFGEPENELCVEKIDETSSLKEIVESIIRNNELFHNYTMHNELSMNSDFKVKMNLYRFIPRNEKGLTVFAKALTYCTLGLFPTSTNEKYILKVEVISKNEQIANVSFNNGIAIWRGLLTTMVRQNNNDDNVVPRKIIEDLVKKTFQNFIDQKLDIFG
jgi:hypothetical protein